MFNVRSLHLSVPHPGPGSRLGASVPGQPGGVDAVEGVDAAADAMEDVAHAADAQQVDGGRWGSG